MVYVVILALSAGVWAQNLPNPVPQPGQSKPPQPEQLMPPEPGRDPSGTGAIVPDTKPLPPEFDTRNPRPPRVWPTPNNWPTPPDDGRLPAPGEEAPFTETGGM